MGKVHSEITPALAAFIARQRLWFVGTAPLSEGGHVNVSPKAGVSSCVVLDSHTVAYADLTGSGAETIGHALENGRITFLFVNIEEGAPLILRLHGHAKCILPEEASSQLLSAFPRHLTDCAGFRAIIWVSVTRVSTSCGYSMPEYGPPLRLRSALDEWAHHKASELGAYRRLKNSFTIDRMPSLALLKQGATATRAVLTGGYWYGEEAAPSEDAADSGACDAAPSPNAPTASSCVSADALHLILRSEARQLPPVLVPPPDEATVAFQKACTPSQEPGAGGSPTPGSVLSTRPSRQLACIALACFVSGVATVLIGQRFLASSRTRLT
jgi:hypothetical protein